MKTVHTLLFTVLIPGSVVGVIPCLLLQGHSESDFDLGTFRWQGATIFCVGAVLLLLSILDFLVKGGGSPAIWFTKPLAFLIGNEPGKLVSSRFYRFSRNPMYLGVDAILLGEAIWFESWNLVAWFVLFAVATHFVVVFVEEPHLRRKFGVEYETFCQQVPRWF